MNICWASWAKVHRLLCDCCPVTISKILTTRFRVLVRLTLLMVRGWWISPTKLFFEFLNFVLSIMTKLFMDIKLSKCHPMDIGTLINMQSSKHHFESNLPNRFIFMSKKKWHFNGWLYTWISVRIHGQKNIFFFAIVGKLPFLKC